MLNSWVPQPPLAHAGGGIVATDLFDSHNEFDSIKTVQCELLESGGCFHLFKVRNTESGIGCSGAEMFGASVLSDWRAELF
jgi:hypothetical protein